MYALQNLIANKNYSKITPLIHLNIMSIIIFGPCLTYLLTIGNENWYVFLIILLVPFIFTFYKYEHYSRNYPDYLDSENYRLKKAKYDIIASKTEVGGLKIKTNLTFDDNDEI